MPDLPVLDPVEQRVLGALLEKQRTVPDSYPLSLNGLRTACNQSTSRDPVVTYDEATLVDTLNRLRDRELVRFVKPTGLRVVKYHQRLEEQLGLDASAVALLATLLLRGPQTPGELRPRTDRLHAFADKEAVEERLRGLAAEDPPLVRELERQAGRHDSRWVHLLGAELPPEAMTPVAAVDREQVLSSGGLARDRKVTAEYDQLAEAYAIALGDELADKPFDRWFLEELANSAPGQGLDVGCGPGQVAGLLAGLDMEMTGLDLSPVMLEQARELHPDVTFVQGTFAVPPMPRGSDPREPGWGLVTAWYALVHLAQSEIAPAVAALAKVLCRGGHLAIATHVGDEVQHPGELFGEPTELDFVLHDPEVVIAAAEAAGLVDIEWYVRSPLPDEAPTRRLYLQGRKPG
ncbi:hypothetical protein GCM10022204_24270 [Microlunatus aurantiacus]|uniref:Methyltransferase domain-containing protein n=1 Tax=Microlunatus aurantiacus TaxID=446786 RepID=A0ABP7DK83_9ACTN